MLTPQQIQILKRVQQITNPIIRERWMKFFQLPEDLQEAIFSEKINQQILEIAKQKQLMNFQTSILFSVIGSFLSGEIPPNKLIQTIQEECVLEEIKAKELVRQLTKEILSPLKDSLQKIYPPSSQSDRGFGRTSGAEPSSPAPMRPISPVRPMSQSAQNEPSKQKIFVPKLDGNIVNLKDL